MATPAEIAALTAANNATLTIIGQSTAALNNNILLAVAGTAATDCAPNGAQYRSAVIAITNTGGATTVGGVITFESSMNGSDGWAPIPATEITGTLALQEASTVVYTNTPVNTTRLFEVAIGQRYIRGLITTIPSSGVLQARTTLSFANKSLTDGPEVTGFASTRNTVKLGPIDYIRQPGASSVAQLAAGATFTSAIIDAMSYPAALISCRSNLAFTIQILQYDDAAGTVLVESSSFNRTSTTPFNMPVKITGNYFAVLVTNTGASTTTSFLLDTYVGIMETLPTTLTNLGNLRVALTEVPSTSSTLTTGAITTGGTAQQLAVTNPNRRYFLFQNISPVDMRLNFGAAASAAAGLLVKGNGGSYESSAAGVNTGLVSVFCATTGSAFAYMEI